MDGENRAGRGRREAAYPKVRGRLRTLACDGLQPSRHSTELTDGTTNVPPVSVAIAREPERRALAAFSSRDFRLLCGGQAISFTGDSPDANGCISVSNFSTNGAGAYKVSAFQQLHGSKATEVAATSFTVG